MSFAIETHALSRSYETYEKQEGFWASIKGFWNRKLLTKQALAPTTLSIKQGQITGLVGANGAGKTTLLKLLSGLIYPSSGDAQVLGFRPWDRKHAYLKRISLLLGQKNQLWWDIPAADSFSLLAQIYEIPRPRAKERVKELARLLDCEHVLHTQLRRLSLGERMKMEIIGSLLHRPDVLFLDEPTIGLDVVAQTAVRRFLNDRVRQEGPTVILTSHYMDDIAKLADRLLLISRGSIVYDGTVNEFTAKTILPQRLIVKFEEPLASALDLPASFRIEAGKSEFSAEMLARDVPAVVARITAAAMVQELRIEEADFEDVIRSFMEKESRVLSTRSH